MTEAHARVGRLGQPRREGLARQGPHAWVVPRVRQKGPVALEHLEAAGALSLATAMAGRVSKKNVCRCARPKMRTFSRPKVGCGQVGCGHFLPKPAAPGREWWIHSPVDSHTWSRSTCTVCIRVARASERGDRQGFWSTGRRLPPGRRSRPTRGALVYPDTSTAASRSRPMSMLTSDAVCGASSNAWPRATGPPVGRAGVVRHRNAILSYEAATWGPCDRPTGARPYDHYLWRPRENERLFSDTPATHAPIEQPLNNNALYMNCTYVVVDSRLDW